jgi:hypothetical protein
MLSFPTFPEPLSTNESFQFLACIKFKTFPDAVIFAGSANLMKVKQAS